MTDPEANPWRTLSSRVVYENPWMSVREDRVVRPDGREGIYGVMSPRHVATGVVALTPEREVYLVGQFRYTLQVYSWEIVEGGAHPDESPQEGAQRELREETGLVAKDWRQLGGELHISNSITSEVGVVFLAQGLERVGEPRPEGTEVLAVRRVPLTRALEMAEQGEIQDLVSVAGLLLAQRWLERAGPR